MLALKQAYWELRTHHSLVDVWDALLQLSGLQVRQHWCRVVMDLETERLLEGKSDLKTLEISGTKWRHLHSYRSVSYPEYDVCQGPLDERFELIIAEQVWEHLKYPQKALRNVYDMLYPGGYFLITTPFMIRLHGSPLDCSRWTEQGLEYMLSEAGFTDIRPDSWGNRACLKANLNRFMPYRIWHSLKNEHNYPMTVWALARRGSNVDRS